MPKPLAIVVYPTWDTNRAFDQTPEAALASAYDVRVVRVSDEDALLTAVRDATQTRLASLLVIGGHGTPEQLQLGVPAAGMRSALDVKDGALMVAIGQRVVPGGIIALDSCFTGFGHDARRNLANTFHGYAPHTRLFAPDSATGAHSLWRLNAAGEVIRPTYTLRSKVYEIAPGATPQVASRHGAFTLFAFGSPIAELVPLAARERKTTLLSEGAVETYAVDRNGDGRIDHVHITSHGSSIIYRDEDDDGLIDHII